MGDDINDTSLGLSPDHNNKVLLLACGALANEILEIIKSNRLDHLQLHCLPAKLHLYPDKIPDAVEKAVHKYREKFKDIFVVYADCGTGGLLQKKCDELGFKMIPGPHCYAFYEGIEAFVSKAEKEITNFYLTDFLVRQFEAFVIKPLGLNRHPQLKEHYFGSYTKLVYLAQTNDRTLSKKAKEYANYLGLDYEKRYTGYGDLATSLSNIKLVRNIKNNHYIQHRPRKIL